jgi:hypothetical protein
MRCHYDVTLDVQDPDTAAVCALQTTAGSGYLTLVTTTGVSTTSTFGGRRVAHQVSITSAGNISARTFIVSGTDAEGVAISEGITGPNAGTVESTKYFATVTSVAVDGAVGTNTSLGFVDECVTECLTCDAEAAKSSIKAVVTGTINYSVEFTLDKYTRANTAQLRWDDCTDANLVNETADKFGTMVTPILGIRLKTLSYSNGAEIRLTAVQAI